MNLTTIQQRLTLLVACLLAACAAHAAIDDGSSEFTSCVSVCELDSCPENLTVECGDDTDPAATGEPAVFGDSCLGAWSFSDVIDGDDCLYTILGPWWDGILQRLKDVAVLHWHKVSP